MKIIFTRSFEKDYAKLPEQIARRVNKQLNLMLENSRHPSLVTKKIKGGEDIWEGRVTKAYRFTFQMEGEFIILRRVGKHKIVE